MDNILIAFVVIVLALVAAAIYMNNKQHSTYADIIARITGAAPSGSNQVPQANVTVTHTVGGVAPPPPAPPVTGISPQDYATKTLKASTGTAGFVTGASWNEFAYLRLMDAKTFAHWCAQLAALPECAGSGATAGWIQNLSQQGQGIVLTLTAGSTGLVIPDTDPRAA